jgi:C-terminal processing protease CtpA/Prc
MNAWSLRAHSAGRLVALAILLLAVSSCGGGGGSGGGGGGGPSGGGSQSGTWMAGVFQPSSNFINRCQSPRKGTDPFTGRAYPDLQGATVDENNFLRSWTNETYLWYSEVPDLDPALYQTADYFDRLKTSALTSTNAKKDKFHFTYTTADWEALATAGQEVSYGLTWALTQTAPPNRRAFVAFIEPNPPTTTASSQLQRGAEVLTVDGETLANGSDVDKLNAGFFPATAGESHTFTVRDPSGSTRTVTLVSQNFTSTPVQNVHTISTQSGLVGYMQFNDHVATAEGGLIDAINQLKGVQDLVLDIRYNGGGYLDIASELAYMIAGPTMTSGQTFELQQFNSKNPSINPITGQRIAPTDFHTTTQGLQSGLPAGQALPHLDLQRVYVLTGSTTCSASEAIINGLRGVGVDVIQIGSVTCGKPYGFYDQPNCGTTYFSIQFRGVNAKGFGDYTDGFFPANSTITGAADATLPGCSIADDFSHALGDEAEGRLAAALSYRNTSACPTGPTGLVKPFAAEVNATRDVVVPKTPWLENRILRR